MKNARMDIIFIALFGFVILFAALVISDIEMHSVMDSPTYFMHNNVVVSYLVNGTDVTNISKVELWTNLNRSLKMPRNYSNEENATWSLNQTKYYGNVTNYGYLVQFNLSGLTDGSNFKWAMIVWSNASKIADGNSSAYGRAVAGDEGVNETPIAYSENHTAYIEYAPVVELIEPKSGIWKNRTDVLMKIAVKNNVSGVTNASVFQCDIYTNETGYYIVQESVEIKPNSTWIDKNLTNSTNVTHYFPESAGIVWGAACREKNNNNAIGYSFANWTISIDATYPTISVITTNASYNNDSEYLVNWTATDINLQVCKIFTTINFSDTPQTESYDAFNLTEFVGGVNFTRDWSTPDASARNITHTLSTLPLANQSNYTVGLYCNDSAGNTAWSTNLTFIQDTVHPIAPATSNYSVAGSCIAFRLNWSTGEEYTNGSVTHNYTGTDIITTSTSFTKNASLVIEFNRSYPRRYFNWSLTICDRAGNCNGSTIDDAHRYNLLSLLPVCTGYSAYTIPTNMNMSDITNRSGAEIAYWFNSTAQGNPWTTHVNGSSLHKNATLPNGTAIWLYTSNASMWDRNLSEITNWPAWNISVYQGHNLVGMFDTRTAGNISGSLNVSAAVNFTFGDAWNNTAQKWINGFGWNLTWHNDTLFQIDVLEVVWIWSDSNTSWNRTGRPGEV